MYENLGPVHNADGTPSDLTIAMLTGAGTVYAHSDSALNAVARLGGNLIRTNAYDRFLDRVDEHRASASEIVAFSDAMQAFAPFDFKR